MQQFPDPSNISTFEDLDPEPEEKIRRSRARELILAVLLLMGVAGWIGWDWHDQQQKAGEYAAGQRAADLRDWDAAHQHYLAAGNYRDAQVRAGDADKTITERNQHYAVALLSASMGQWAVSLQASQSVNRIQPGFRGTDRLASAAEKQVYEQAVSGTLALRLRDEHPGIYYRGNDAWQWLEGSDRYSEVLGIGTPDHAVFDAPGPNWSPPASENLGQARLYGRTLMEASFKNGEVTTRQLQFDPAAYSFYYWGAKGVWAMRYSFRLPDTTAYGRIDSIFAPLMMEYQAWDSSEVRTVDLPGPSWFVMDIARDSEHILLAEMGDRFSPSSVSNLYLAGPDGANPRLIFSHAGQFESAKFSPDGTAVLVSVDGTFASGLPGDSVTTILLIDPAGKSTPVPLAENVRAAPCPSDACEMASATFLDRGRLSGRILLARWGTADDPSTLSIIDPREPAKSLAELQIEGMPSPYTEGAWVTQAPEGDSVVVSWHDGIERDQDTIAGVLSLEGKSQAGRVSWPESAYTSWKLIRNNQFLVYSYVQSGGEDSQTGNFEIQSAPLVNLTAQADITRLWSGADKQYNGFSTASASFAGPQMLAYTQGEVLHARAYDGIVDVSLESGVSKFFYMPYMEVSYLR